MSEMHAGSKAGVPREAGNTKGTEMLAVLLFALSGEPLSKEGHRGESWSQSLQMMLSEVCAETRELTLQSS